MRFFSIAREAHNLPSRRSQMVSSAEGRFFATRRCEIGHDWNLCPNGTFGLVGCAPPPGLPDLERPQLRPRAGAVFFWGYGVMPGQSEAIWPQALSTSFSRCLIDLTPTSTNRHSAWRPNPGRRSTYQRGESVQTTGTSSLPEGSILSAWP